MLEQVNTHLREAKQRRDESLAIRSQLPRQREELSREMYRLRSLEARLEDMQAYIDKLGSVSLAALASSLLGRKEQQLAECHEQLAALQKGVEECAAIVAGLSDQIGKSEASLNDADDIDREVEALLAHKQDLVMETGGTIGEALREVVENLECAKTYHHGLDIAVQVGNHLTDRLHSLTRSVGRARNKGISPSAGGAFLATAVTAVMRNSSAKPAVQRVIDGLERFQNAVTELELNEDDPRDARLLSLVDVVAGFAAEVKSQGASGAVADSSHIGPMHDALQEAIGHLKDISAEVSDQIKSLEAEKQSLLSQV